MVEIRRKDIVEAALSYDVVGILFDVYDKVGPDHREYVYQKALSLAFKKNGLAFKEQVRAPLMYEGQRIGTVIFDFVIAERLVLEIKSSHGFRKRDYEQAKHYLVISGLPLAILARFSPE